MTRGLVHPHMLPRVTANFFPHNVSFQQDIGGQAGSGQMIENWTLLAGYTNVPCRIGPVSTMQEQKLAQYVTVGADSVILIVGNYDGQLTTSMRLLDQDGKAYDILTVEIDSARQLTRVLARVRS